VKGKDTGGVGIGRGGTTAAPHGFANDEMATRTRVGTRRSDSMLRRHWPQMRILLGFGILGLAVWVLASHTDELSGLSAVFENLNWWWIPIAVVAEMASFACFAGMQFELLRCGGLDAPKAPLFKMTLAAQALANSLPGGTAVSAVYGFRWFRRFGADAPLAAWTMVGTLVGAFLSLALVATAGLALATGEGASLDLIPVIVGALVATILIGALFVYERPLFLAVTWVIGASQSIFGRPRGDTRASIQRIIGSITSVRLGPRQVVTVVLWGTGNWLFDCACFAMMFLAVHTSIPWNGLLLAYGAGQLAASLPITPGGLGAVEGSITIALVAFGGARTTTVDAVLMYRLISFWLVLLIGWALWGELAFEVRKGRWRRRALGAPVEAGGGLDPASESLPTASADRPSAVRP
jgi:uncharacterized protein (TIRG00374 family)